MTGLLLSVQHSLLLHMETKVASVDEHHNHTGLDKHSQEHDHKVD